MSSTPVPPDTQRKSNYDRHDVRLIGGISGCYALPQRRSKLTAQIPVYAAQLRSISTRRLVAYGPIVPVRGEKVLCHFEQLGVLRGTIDEGLSSGFVLALELNPHQRDALGTKIEWQKRRMHEKAPDTRRHKRVLPRDPRTRMREQNGLWVACHIIDMSQSGVAISAELRPAIGTPVAIGNILGHVVRHMELGFAVKFLKTYPLEELEERLRPPSIAKSYGELFVNKDPAIPQSA